MDVVKPIALEKLYEDTSYYLPDGLIDKHNKKKMSDCVALFTPNMQISCLGYECSLQEENRWGDFHFELFLTDTILNELETSFSQNHWRSIFSWEKVSAFFNNWSQHGVRAQNTWAPRVGLELDTGSSDKWPPRPNLFFELNESPLPIQDAFFWSNGECLTEQTLTHIKRCYSDNFKINYVGFMLGRNVNALRLVSGKKKLNDPSQLINYLSDLQHPCLNSELKTLIETYATLSDEVFFELDLGEKFFPRLGINCYIEGPTLSEKKNKWQRLLATLGKNNLANLKQTENLLQWLGASREIIPTLDFRHDSSVQYSHVNLLREINHIKIDYVPQQKLKCKAYLRAVGIA